MADPMSTPGEGQREKEALLAKVVRIIHEHETLTLLTGGEATSVLVAEKIIALIHNAGASVTEPASEDMTSFGPADARRIREEGRCYDKTGCVWAIPVLAGTSVMTREGDVPQVLKMDGFIATDGKSCWPIAADFMAEHYRVRARADVEGPDRIGMQHYFADNGERRCKTCGERDTHVWHSVGFPQANVEGPSEPDAWMVQAWVLGAWDIVTPGAWRAKEGAERAAELERRNFAEVRVVPVGILAAPATQEAPARPERLTDAVAALAHINSALEVAGSIIQAREVVEIREHLEEARAYLAWTPPASPSAPAEPLEALREQVRASLSDVLSVVKQGPWGRTVFLLPYEAEAILAALSVSTSAPKETR